MKSLMLILEQDNIKAKLRLLFFIIIGVLLLPMTLISCCCHFEHEDIELDSLSFNIYSVYIEAGGNKFSISRTPDLIRVECTSNFMHPDSQMGKEISKSCDLSPDPVWDEMVRDLLSCGEYKKDTPSWAYMNPRADGENPESPDIMVRISVQGNSFKRYIYKGIDNEACFPDTIRQIHAAMIEYIYSRTKTEFSDIPMWFPFSATPPKNEIMIPDYCPTTI